MDPDARLAILARAKVLIVPVSNGVFVRIRRIALATSGAVLAALALGACSDDEKDADATATDASASGSTNTDNPPASQGADGSPTSRATDSTSGGDNTNTDGPELAKQSIAAMNKLEFIENSGTSVDKNGKSSTVKACAVMQTKAVVGTTRQSNGTQVQVIMVGGVQYTKTSAQGWAELTGNPSRASAYQQVIGDKWVTSDSEATDDVNFFDGETDGVTKGAVTDFQGKKAIPLVKTKANGAKKTYYVAAQGDPLILGQTEEGPEPKKRTATVITEADKCDATVPASSQTITATEVDRRVKQLSGA